MSFAPETSRPAPTRGPMWQQPRQGEPSHMPSSSGPPWGMIATGALVVGLGLLALRYFGPDLRRYIKIESM